MAQWQTLSDRINTVAPSEMCIRDSRTVSADDFDDDDAPRSRRRSVVDDDDYDEDRPDVYKRQMWFQLPNRSSTVPRLLEQ